MKGPIVHINGMILNEGHSMTIRVALESFATILEREGLGDDEHGKTMTRLYLERIAELRHALAVIS